MKITYVIGNLGLGGKERQLIYLLNKLPKNIKKQLIILSENIEYKIDCSILDEIMVIDRKKKYSYATIKNIYQRIKQFSPDIIHSWDYISPIILKPLGITNKIKIVNGSLRTSGPQLKRIKTRLQTNFLIYLSDISVCNSIACLETLKLSHSNKVKCIYNGFDISKFDSSQKKLKLPQEHTNSCKICMVGRFQPSKDYDFLLKVASSLEYKIADFYLIGDGPNRRFIEDKVRELNLNNIHFLGKRNDVPSILAQCDIGLLFNPESRAEGISNAVMEYMASKLPVISTNTGGTPELVKDNRTGYLVNAGDKTTVVNLLKKLIVDKDLRHKMGTEGRKIIVEKYSINKMVNSYMNLYKGLLIK